MKAVVVMPNTRSIVYLKDEFKKLAQGNPLILPKMLSMDGLVQEINEETIIDDISARLILYESFKKVKNSEESLESFLSLGQTLYADFEEIVRNLKPLNLIFKELSQWEETGANFADFLDDEQKELLERFWSHFNEKNLTEMKMRFIVLWRSLPGVFEDFQQKLKDKKALTSGLAYAKASSFSQNHPFISKYNSFYFVGFGQLSGSEIKLVSRLNELGKSKLNWDLRSWYLQMPDHEASRLFSGLKRIPVFAESLESVFKDEDNALPETNFEIIRCLGLAGMAQQINLLTEKSGPETAVIITDTGLIQALVETGSQKTFQFNVTMGFPIAYSHFAKWIQKVFVWLERKDQAYSDGLEDVLQDPFFQKMCPFAFSEWRHFKDNVDFQYKTSVLQSKLSLSPAWLWSTEMKIWISWFSLWWKSLDEELLVSSFERAAWTSFVSVFENLEKLVQNIDGKIVTPRVVQQLFTSLLSKYPIAIKGAHNEGVQVMGLFESRLLDFKHVIIASAEEGSLPGNVSGQSFLTENLRNAFRLPSRSQKVEDEIYQFYRLSHNAEKIILLLNQSAETQPSRIVQQVRYTPGLKSSDKTQAFGHSMPLPKPIEIKKNEFIFNKLKDFQPTDTEKSKTYLSPSSLHDLLQCELRFHFKKIEKLEDPEETKSLEMNPMDFGKWVHETIQTLYAQICKTGKYLEEEDYIKMKLAWESTQYETWKSLKDKKSEGTLDDFMIEKEVGKLMAFRFFDFMTQEKSHRWIANEVDMERADLEFDGQKWTLGGRVDIVFETESETWILDLKTGAFDKPGAYHIKSDKLERLLPKILANKDLFQMLVYDWLAAKSNKMNHKNARSKLFYMADPKGTLVDPLELATSYNDIELIFIELETIIGSVLKAFSNPQTNIRQTDEQKYCAYCTFASICKR